MIGIVDVGGGLRGIYGAGVFDFCLEQGIRFDHCVGVSAGSANIAAYLAGQKGRNYRFYTEYAFRGAYMSFSNLLRQGSYINLDYVYSTLSNSGGEDPLDYASIACAKSGLTVVATNALSGDALYFDKRDIAQDNYDIFKASCCIPALCRPYVVGGVPCFDGGVADPVPLERLWEAGCEKAVIILTRPLSMPRVPKKDALPARLLRKKYPAAARAVALRYKRYNEGVAKALEAERQGRALVLAPDDLCGMKTLTRDKSALVRMYAKGRRDAARLSSFLL